MQQHQGQSLSQRFQQYRPSKTALFWSCGGCVVLATIVGFSWGGWTTGGTAREMAENAAAQARQELAAVVCVDRFMAAPDVGAQLTALKGIDAPISRASSSRRAAGRRSCPPAPLLTARRVLMTAKRPGCAPRAPKREIATPEKAALIDDEAVVAQ